MNIEDKNIAIIGLGMMGGALATGLKQLNPAHISAYDLNNEILEKALEDRNIDFGTDQPKQLQKILSESDLVFICLYPQDTIKFLKDNMEFFKSGAIVTDIVGIKRPIINVLNEILRDDINYIPGHPMAGSEKEGYGGADYGIFQNRNYVLVPLPDSAPDVIADFKSLLTDLGFSNIVETTALDHDRKIAYTSQLCHIIASALVDSEDDLTITDFEGGSYADLTRIAMINAPMWSEIFIDNKELLLEQIEEFEESLDKLKKYIKNSSKSDLEDMLSDVRNKRVIMEVDRINKHRMGE